jgi:tungstate transport system substrate-binding protein
MRHKEAMAFVNWLTAPGRGQKIISEFGKEKYGSPLFFPDSREWHSSLTK